MDEDIKTVAESFDNEVYKLGAEMDIQGGQKCQLYHHPKDPAGPAVDFLHQHFGVNGNHTETLRIAVCQDCLDAILGNEWILFYCIHCNRSRWVSRKYTLRKYKPTLQIKWFDGCPGCISFR